MSTKNDYTADEWKAITAAPFLAGLFVSMSDLSGIGGLTKEALAVGRVLNDGASSGPEVVKSLAESLKAAGFSGRPELPQLPTGDQAARRLALVQHIQNASSVIAAKSPAEAEAYKTWLLGAAKTVAEAAKEGGFLGFGGTRVSQDEQTALNELSTALGVKA